MRCPSPFSRLETALPDPIFTVAGLARAAGPEAVDATVGIILSEEGKPQVFSCVRSAARQWASTFESGNFAYPPLLGVRDFRESVVRLIFGDDRDCIASIASTGGTGALAIQLKLLRRMGIHRSILPLPSWPNHRRLLDAFGFAVCEVQYLREGNADASTLIESLRSKEPHCVLLQASCHNPTGIDFSEAQWRAVADALAESPHVVLLDLAYQGLGQGIEEDAFILRLLRERNIPFLLAWSASKNHSIYGLRTGLACASTAEKSEVEKIEQHYSILTRELHSASSVAGQEIVAIVQREHLSAWKEELHSLRTLLAHKRSLIAEIIPSVGSGRGMFCILPFDRGHIELLRKRNVFTTDDGRVNIAGIPLSKMEEFFGVVGDVRKGL